MKTLNKILAGNSLFFGLWLLFFAVGLFFLLTLGKAASFVDLNAYHRSTLDTVFIWVTFLGNGVFSIVVFVIFLLQRRWSQATQVMVAFLLSGIAVGYSRIYLGQHFLGDVLTGSCIGTFTAVLVHWLFVEKLQ